MAENTKNLGLIKPSKEDFYNIENFNENFQKIDDFVGGYGYYIGNVDDLKQPGSYIILIGHENAEMSGTFPLDDLLWYTVNVFSGGTGSIVQDWVSATEPPRRFIRHFDGIKWGSYIEIANTQNPTFYGDVTFEKDGYGKTTLCKQNEFNIDYGTELTDHDVNGGRTKLIIRSNIDLKMAVGFSSTITGKFYKLFGEHNLLIIPIESVDCPGCFYHKVGSELEWINPPMLNENEYRTMERYLGKPVYTITFKCGAISVGDTHSILIEKDTTSALTILEATITDVIRSGIGSSAQSCSTIVSGGIATHHVEGRGNDMQVFHNEDKNLSDVIATVKYIYND